ncbi:MAG: outer membrane protein assembly factor BamC [Burkholderiaceae bacterium]|nr:outer membrane protein assembly factor BamC [Burkholderiaceae bacterium]
MRFAPPALAVGLVLSLAACSVFDSDTVDYKSSQKAPSLEVPPDLSQLASQNTYAVPGSAVSANVYTAAQASAPASPTAVDNVNGMRLEGDGTQRWLFVTDRTPDQLWDAVHDFWQENGFVFTTEERKLGIMETDWAEDHAKLPHDFIRATLGKLLDSVYSTGQLDRFRTRMEKTPQGTEIYISHRGMEEVYTSKESEGRRETRWQQRPADPGLETTFLRRLIVKLGATEAQAKAAEIANPAPRTQRAHIVEANGQPALRIDEGFNIAWRRVGLALDRTSFTVENRDRAAGIYSVRYVPPDANRQEQGLFSRLFGKEKTDAPLKYRIVVRGEGAASTMTVQDDNGGPVATKDAQSIVKVVADSLN